MKKLFFFLIFIALITIFSINIKSYANTNIILSVDDPAGDDFGPGTYKYPTDKTFYPYKGLFDIIKFKIIRDMDEYVLFFTFKNITDPWEGKFNFSLPLLELYIDNIKGGSVDLFKDGANVRLDPKYPWDKLIKISGWWVRSFVPEDRERNEDDIFNFENNPWDVKDFQLKRRDNTIILTIKKELTGSLENANIYLLVGSFDPFGFDHFRGVENESSSWKFFDSANNNVDYSTRVIDIILPAGKKQEKILRNNKDDYPMIYPLKVEKPNLFNSYVNPHIFIFIIISIVSILLMLNNKHKNRHNNKK
jgi:carbohydrate-binding DOMON domain-containing protein